MEKRRSPRPDEALLGLEHCSPRLPQRRFVGGRGAALASTVFHALLVACAVLVSSTVAGPGRLPAPPSPAQSRARLIFIARPEQLKAQGGGGGGGPRATAVVAKETGAAATTAAEPATTPTSAHMSDRATVPVMLSLAPSPHTNLALVLNAPPVWFDTASAQQPGSGGGIGTGTGTGVGSGSGDGVGSGRGGGFGIGAHRIGGVATAPVLLLRTPPRYTTEALDRHIQGTVELEVVVGRDGVPRDARVTRSLDPGLDAEAIVAVRHWRFTPGRLGQTAVDVVITVLMDFRIS